MPPAPTEQFVVTQPRQRRLLTSPLRFEILEQFALAADRESRGRSRAAQAGASIAEVANAMARRPDSLYHHVRLLAKSGLLVKLGTRKAGKRDEALYRPVANQIAMPCDPRQPSSVQSTVATVAAMFRLAEREMRSALVGGELVPSGPLRNLFARRTPARLSPAALKQVNRHIDAILEITERERRRDATAAAADAQPMSITIALLPMHSRRRTQRSSPESEPC